MKLNEEQIDVLFKFTRKKWVHWYDLQVELVDHLAARIEEEMSADTKLSFQQALDKVYAEFGIFGFAKIVQSAEKSVRKKNNLIWFHALSEQFTWPTLVRSTCILLVLLIGGSLAGMQYVTFSVIAGALILSSVEQYRSRHVQKKCNKLLLTQNIPTYNFGFIGIHIYCIPKTLGIDSLPLFAPHSVLLLFIAFSVVILNLTSRNVVKQILTEAETSYPEIFAVPNS